MDDRILLVVLSGAFGIASAYGAQILRNHYGSARKPSSMEVVISGYESLIQAQRAEIDRKQKYIDELQVIIDKLQLELSDSKQRLESFQEQLSILKSDYESKK